MPHRGALHEETFGQRSEGVFESDRYRQQVRLAVLVAQTRGADWSGVCAVCDVSSPAG